MIQAHRRIALTTQSGAIYKLFPERSTELIYRTDGSLRTMALRADGAERKVDALIARRELDATGRMQSTTLKIEGSTIPLTRI